MEKSGINREVTTPPSLRIEGTAVEMPGFPSEKVLEAVILVVAVQLIVAGIAVDVLNVFRFDRNRYCELFENSRESATLSGLAKQEQD